MSVFPLETRHDDQDQVASALALSLPCLTAVNAPAACRTIPIM